MNRITDIGKVADLIPLLEERDLPLIREEADLKEVIRAMIRFDRNRLLYVVDGAGRLTGAISMGTLVRQVFSSSYEPQIHSGSIIKTITAQSAKDIMRRNPVAATAEEDAEAVLRKMIRTNTEEIPVLNDDDQVIADLKMTDLLRFLIKFE